jgi:hypothetical protein
MTVHVVWTALLYVALTIVRAPTVWKIGARADGSNPLASLEPRISANLKNQFEWPLFFYVACLLAIALDEPVSQGVIPLAWLFVAGRFVHSGVQILTTNVRVRGVVFTANFLAVLGMWAGVVMSSTDKW